METSEYLHILNVIIFIFFLLHRAAFVLNIGRAHKNGCRPWWRNRDCLASSSLLVLRAQCRSILLEAPSHSTACTYQKQQKWVGSWGRGVLLRKIITEREEKSNIEKIKYRWDIEHLSCHLCVCFKMTGGRVLHIKKQITHLGNGQYLWANMSKTKPYWSINTKRCPEKCKLSNEETLFYTLDYKAF